MTTRMPASPLRLTEFTDCGGCAAKLGADVLADVLAGLGAQAAPDDLIAGLHPPDDAAVYRLSPELAVIGTLDFFPPLVDDPRTFGEIAAANALSDVFAMGGRVLFAMAIAAFPEEMPRDALAAIFDGAAAKVREAGGTLAGGHTIRDAEPKYGLAVVGVAHPERLLRKGGALPGDVLLLTKRLGTGLLVSGARQGRTSPAAPRAGRRSDARPQPRGVGGPLGSTASAPRPTSPASASSATASRWRAPQAPGSSSMPTPCPRSTAPSISPRPASRPAARRTTAASSPPNSRSRSGVRPEIVALAHDPQTSGGLLAAVPAADSAERCRRDLEAAGVPSWIVGRVEPGSGVALR